MAGQPPGVAIVVGCQKGGIGRTVVAVNVAATLALAGRRTLLLDLDPKGDATASLGLPRATEGKTVERLSEPWSLLEDVLSVEQPPGLDVWPGGPAIEALNAELSAEDSPATDLLERGLSLARQRYRAVVVDAPPDLGPLACNALASGNVLLLPLSPTAAAERALEETVSAAWHLRDSLKVFGLRLGVPDAQLETGNGETDTRGPLGIELLDHAVCRDGDTLDRAAAQGLPVFEYAPASRAARSFLEVGRELLDKVFE